MTLRIRLSPERAHQKHHHLQVLLSIVCLPCWMPPTPGMSEVEAVPQHQRSSSPGTLHSAPTSQTPEAEKKVKIASD